MMSRLSVRSQECVQGKAQSSCWLQKIELVEVLKTVAEEQEKAMSCLFLKARLWDSANVKQVLSMMRKAAAERASKAISSA